ncbi:hypothetical protein E4O05_09440 [Treponema sp. OMZ 787]|nr:hypothetical protein E4O05_09440 [Treponema sp. OMZ 787]
MKKILWGKLYFGGKMKNKMFLFFFIIFISFFSCKKEKCSVWVCSDSLQDEKIYMELTNENKVILTSVSNLYLLFSQKENIHNYGNIEQVNTDKFFGEYFESQKMIKFIDSKKCYNVYIIYMNHDVLDLFFENGMILHFKRITKN